MTLKRKPCVISPVLPAPRGTAPAANVRFSVFGGRSWQRKHVSKASYDIPQCHSFFELHSDEIRTEPVRTWNSVVFSETKRSHNPRCCDAVSSLLMALVLGLNVKGPLCLPHCRPGIEQRKLCFFQVLESALSRVLTDVIVFDSFPSVPGPSRKRHLCFQHITLYLAAPPQGFLFTLSLQSSSPGLEKHQPSVGTWKPALNPFGKQVCG